MVVRPATAADAGLLAGFQCSTGPWYEQDVESFVRERALEQALALSDAYRLLLVLEGKRPIGCMAHHHEMLLTGDGRSSPIFATRLHLLAIATDDQGRKLDDGTRLSDKLMTTLIADALETRGNAVLTGIVALENLRSMALCERHGMRSQVQYDTRHARLSGHFTPRHADVVRAAITRGPREGAP
jgi:hypothetical protein